MPHNFRGRDFAHLNPNERTIWRAGRWAHERHGGRLGWWWVAGDVWYFYPEPIYPYPTYISDYLIPVPQPISPQFWYYCDDPPGYYPEVQACYDQWQLIPVMPPPGQDTLGPQASADIRAGYRIAQDICSACHFIRPGQQAVTVLVQPGPSFEEIANRPGTSAESLGRFIAGTSWDLQSRPITMPSQGLSERSINQVASYIMTLRREQP